MQYVVTVGIIFTLCAQFGILFCSRRFDYDPVFRKEVGDFAEFLRRKSEKESFSNDPFPLKGSSEDSNGNHEGSGKPNVPEFRSFLEELSRKNPNGNENLQGGGAFLNPNGNENLQGGAFSKTNGNENLQGRAFSNLDRKPLHETAEKPQEVEEFLYMRRSPPEVNDPIPEVVDRFVNDRPMEHPVRQVRKPAKRSSSTATQTCHFTPNVRQTCDNGSEYEMKFHPAFFEALRRDMEDLLPGNREGKRKCDFRKRLGPDRGVEDRALCPFKFNVSQNSSRFPEFLYVAECSCQVSRPINNEQLQCVEVKRVVPVLWIVSCSDGKKTYKEGWDEIVVACAPVEERRAGTVEPNYMK